MKKKNLEDLISGMLIPEGFKKKGNYWIINGSELTYIVHLQKSQFGNSFYVNFGFVINSIPLNGLRMHIFKQVSSNDKIEQLRISNLLNLDNDIAENERSNGLKNILKVHILDNITNIKSEEDLKEMIEQFPPEKSNMVSLAVKKHLKIGIL